MKRIVLLLSALAAVLALAGTAQAASPGDTVTYNYAGQQQTGIVWVVIGDNLLVDDGAGNVHSIPASAVVTAPPGGDPGGGDPGGGDPGTPPPSDTLGRPYSDASAFNNPVPAGQPVLGSSSAYVTKIMQGKKVPTGLTASRSGANDWTHAIYFAKATDPTATIRCNSGGVNGRVINVPAGAQSAAGGDGHFTAVQPDGWEYDLWQAKVSAGVVQCNIGYRQRYDGNGYITTQMKQADPSIGGGTEANFGSAFGQIRAREIQAGVIPHALFVVSSCVNGFVFPAQKSSGSCAGGPPMGSWLKLNMSVAQIDASCAPGWEKTFAKAYATYGAFIGDKGGDGLTFMTENATQYTSIGQADPWAPIAQQYGWTKNGTYGYAMRWSGCIDYSKTVVLAPPAA